MEYFVIGDEDTVLGFSLCGVEGQVVHSKEDAVHGWERALEDSQFGVILITTPAANYIRDTVDKFLFSESFPLVVELSGADGERGKDLKSLVNDAIGVSI